MANEIDRPRGGYVVQYDGAPRQVPNNPIDRVLARFDARGRTKTLQTITAETRAQTENLLAIADGGRALIVVEDIRNEIAGLPAKYAHQARINATNREIEYGERLFEKKMAVMRGEEATLHQEAKIQHARNALEDALQQGEAIKKYGHQTHELRQKQQQLEALGLKLREEELLKEIKKVWEPNKATDKRVLEQLHRLRDAEASAGMDTSILDALLSELE
jgi:hypothetical protein